MLVVVAPIPTLTTLKTLKKPVVIIKIANNVSNNVKPFFMIK
jgi:hypothetical protein